MVLKITPSGLEVPVEAGDAVYFRISASSPSPVNRFTIIRIGNGLDSVLLDTVPMSKSFFLNWGYQTKITELQNVQLLFRITNETGEEQSLQRILVIKAESQLSLFTSNYMSSMPSNFFNAFDFGSMNTVTFDSSLAVPLQPDVREFNNDTSATSSDLSGFWYSPSGGKFVKTAAVNFSNITKAELLVFFNGSYLQQNTTDLLQVGDIYAYKSSSNDPNPVVCIFRIDEFKYPPNTPEARYIFSVKK